MVFSNCGAVVVRDTNDCTKRRTDTPLQGTTVRRLVILVPTTTLAHDFLGEAAALFTEVRRRVFYEVRSVLGMRSTQRAIPCGSAN
jgi:hypothetical protein